MILHVTFSDGSNPWVSLPGDRHTIAKQWRQWMKNHPDTARPEAIYNNYRVVYIAHDGDNQFFLIPQRAYTGQDIKCYKYLGHALTALERLGGAK